MKTHKITPVLLALSWAQAGLAQDAHPFGGITLVNVVNTNVNDAVGILHTRFGRQPGSSPADPDALWLLTVMSGNRSYASFNRSFGAGGHQANCMAWNKEQTESPGQFVHGDGDAWFDASAPPRQITNNPDPKRSPAATRSRTSMTCAEFRLERVASNRIRFIKNDLRIDLPILANYPIVAIDWSDPSISRFRVDGYGLGEITESDIPGKYVRPEPARLAYYAPVAGNLKELRGGGYLDIGQVQVSAYADTDEFISEGKTEVLFLNYSLSRAQNLGTTEAVYEDLRDRYGTPSAEIVNRDPKRPDLIWAHDLDGGLLSDDEDSDDPCLSNLADLNWAIRTRPRLSILNDTGPWGCGVVMIMTRISETGYNAFMFHGHAIAHLWLSDRLDLVDSVRVHVPERLDQQPELETPPDTVAAFPSRRAVRRVRDD